ncbi:hypothetical protein [Phyllobacterium sp. K27]
MKILYRGLLLFVLVFSVACSSQSRLKTPCALPASAAAFGPDDCGPLLPVNEALNHAVLTTQ